MLFLDASDTALVKRYDATRRKHPLDGEAPGLVEAIDLERALLEPVKAAADLVIDTTELNVHQLKAKLLAAFDEAGDGQRLQIAVESFGFKHGLPHRRRHRDGRALPAQPALGGALRPLTGHDPAVRDFVLERAQASDFLDRFEGLMLSLLPSYEAEGKSYLTVAIGCTGGRHRSVAVAEELARRLREHGYAVRTGHRGSEPLSRRGAELGSSTANPS